MSAPYAATHNTRNSATVNSWCAYYYVYCAPGVLVALIACGDYDAYDTIQRELSEGQNQVEIGCN